MSDFLKKLSRSLGLSYAWWHWGGADERRCSVCGARLPSAAG